MNCPQCQTANAPGSAFCGNCGARLAVSEPAGSPGAGYGAQGTGTPLGYGAAGGPASYDAPAGYDQPSGYNAPAGYDQPSGYNAPAGYNAGSPAQQGGYPQGQYQRPQGQGGYTPGTTGGSVPPVSFDLNRLTTVDKIVAVGSLIAMISIWLPWYSISWSGDTFQPAGSASLSGTFHGWLWLEFVVALVLIAYLVARAAWGQLPFAMPVAHAPLLIVGTALQLLIVLIAFVDIPYGNLGVGLTWGAFLGLLAALAAAGPVIYPAVRSYLASRNAAGGNRQF
jgi:hypothetical protein